MRFPFARTDTCRKDMSVLSTSFPIRSPNSRRATETAPKHPWKTRVPLPAVRRSLPPTLSLLLDGSINIIRCDRPWRSMRGLCCHLHFASPRSPSPRPVGGRGGGASIRGKLILSVCGKQKIYFMWKTSYLCSTWNSRSHQNVEKPKGLHNVEKHLTT